MRNLIATHLPQILWFCLLWLAATICASVLYRLKRRMRIFTRPSRGARFVQWCASGRSLRNWMTGLGGAHGCLLVYMVSDRLFITPMFPFNLMFLPEIFRLEHEIKRKAIGRLEERRGLFGKRLIIHFRTDRDERLELRLRDPAAFLKAIATR